MLVGYVRIIPYNQDDVGSQLRALKAVGCERIIEERGSGGLENRPKLAGLLGELEEGDVVVVWKLDRLTHSFGDMLSILERIETAGAGFRSLTEAIDTMTPAGRMLIAMLSSFGELRRKRANRLQSPNGGFLVGPRAVRKDSLLRRILLPRR